MNDLLARVRELCGALHAALRPFQKITSRWGDIRGRRLFWSIETRRNRATKPPSPPLTPSPPRIGAAAQAP